MMAEERKRIFGDNMPGGFRRGFGFGEGFDTAGGDSE